VGEAVNSFRSFSWDESGLNQDFVTGQLLGLKESLYKLEKVLLVRRIGGPWAGF
jgi:hypothetical protein